MEAKSCPLLTLLTIHYGRLYRILQSATHIAVLSEARKARSMFVKAVDSKNILDVLPFNVEKIHRYQTHTWGYRKSKPR